MEPVEKEKAALISGIETDARAEEEKIIKEAENQAAEKRKYSEKKVESLLNDARKKAEEQAETAKEKIISTAEREVKRCSMRVRDAVVHNIMDRVEKKLNSMMGTDNYKSVLTDWITEAAIGLGAESALINASEQERALINGHMLSEIARRIQKQTGRKISLTLSDAEPLQLQGIVLTAADGRTAFNNQVKTRMLRKQREIQTLIYNSLFNYDQKE
ncbi:MAG: V-type ATP synthase subunit E [Planctomycetota bacterium]|jgi:vacuolar-type H+-ATPase subunit E/Vma4